MTIQDIEKELRSSYVQLGKLVLEKSLEFSANFSKPTRPRQCSKGLSCKGTCFDLTESCNVRLAGQAKAYAGWLQGQIKTGAAVVEKTGVEKPGSKAKPKDTGEDNPETLHGWLIYKGKEALGPELAKKLESAFNESPAGLDKLKAELKIADQAFDKEIDRLNDDIGAAFKTPAGKRFSELQGQVNELEAAAEKNKIAVMTEVRQHLLDTGLDREEALRMAYSVTVNKAVIKAYGEGGHDAVNEDLAEFFQLTNGAGKGSFKKLAKDDARAYADPETGKVNIGQFKSVDERRENLFHEIAHHEEFREDKDFTRLAMVSWVQARADDQKQVPLNTIVGRNLFDAEEVAYRDAYVNPYVGKTYKEDDGPNAKDAYTEVLSVGTEHFISPEKMAKLYRKDPYHFWLTVGAYRDNDD